MFSDLQNEKEEWDDSKLRQFLTSKINRMNMNCQLQFNLEFDKVFSNPCAMKGKLYDRFKQKFDSSETKKIEYVFHGTSAENVNNIFIHGLDPNLRGGTNGQVYGKGEYFSYLPTLASFYARNIGNCNRIIIFAILKDPNVIVYDESQILVVNDISHQLPLFVINFRYLHYKEKHRQTWEKIKKAPICQIPSFLIGQPESNSIRNDKKRKFEGTTAEKNDDDK